MPLRVVLLLLFHLLHIGCDGVVGSARVLDACGVCGGLNTTCQIISGIFTEPRLSSGYSLVVQIPASACSIHIEELGATKNYLALRDIHGQFIINGDWNIDNSGSYRGAGATFLYRRQSTRTAGSGDRITAVGPIAEPVDIVILYQEVNRGIKYEYAIKRNNSLNSVLPRLPDSLGRAQVPPLMSKLLRPAGDQRPPNVPAVLPSRGAGDTGFVSPLYQPSRPAGQTDRGRSADPRIGSVVGRARPAAIPRARPAGAASGGDKAGRGRPGASPGASPRDSSQRRRRRRRRRRRFQWSIRGYSACSRTCGGGSQTPQVVCVRRKRKQQVRERKCDPRRRPKPQSVSCNTSPCPASWEPNPWSACSVSCGSGHQTRTFLCVRDGRPVEVTSCVGRPELPATEPCRLTACPAAAGRWRPGQWSPCSVSCGWGSRTRQVTCSASGQDGWCSQTQRPRDEAPCRLQDCGPAAQNDRWSNGWMFTDWSEQCSVQCGQGVQSRGVTCGGGTDRCDVTERPQDTRPCKTDRGCGGVWFTGPWSQCSHECSSGVATRPVACVSYLAGRYSVTDEQSCRPPPPDRQRPCRGAEAHCRARWFVSEWSTCSSSCGAGWQRRTVACVDATGRPANRCPPAAAPAERRACLLTDCPKLASAFSLGARTTTAAPSAATTTPSAPSAATTTLSAPTVSPSPAPATTRQHESLTAVAGVDWPADSIVDKSSAHPAADHALAYMPGHELPAKPRGNESVASLPADNILTVVDTNEFTLHGSLPSGSPTLRASRDEAGRGDSLGQADVFTVWESNQLSPINWSTSHRVNTVSSPPPLEASSLQYADSVQETVEAATRPTAPPTASQAATQTFTPAVTQAYTSMLTQGSTPAATQTPTPTPLTIATAAPAATLPPVATLPAAPGATSTTETAAEARADVVATAPSAAATATPAAAVAVAPAAAVASAAVVAVAPAAVATAAPTSEEKSAPTTPQRRHRKRKSRNGRKGGDKLGRSNVIDRRNSDSCTDKLSYCSAVQQARLCKYKYYKNSCCATCQVARYV